jgi:hypothetical protein
MERIAHTSYLWTNINHHSICIIQVCGRNEKKQTVKPLLSVIRCINTDNKEYPHPLYLLALTVSNVSDTGTQTNTSLSLLTYV